MAIDFQPPLDVFASTNAPTPRPERFRVSENLEREMHAMNFDARMLALWSELPVDLVISVLSTRRASKRIVTRLRAGLRLAASDSNKPVEHLTFAYLATKGAVEEAP